MPSVLNSHGQPTGAALPDWSARHRPVRSTIEGRWCRLEPLNAASHAADLYAAYSEAPDGRDWTYMMAGPFDDAGQYRAYAEIAARSEDPLHHAVIDQRTGRAVGTLSLMRIDPANGVIEVGNVAFSPLLKRSPVSTEAQYLLMKRVFDELGYRRYEWKCDSHNAPSRRAAARLGFQYEGLFRQAVVYKGRTRDTAGFRSSIRSGQRCEPPSKRGSRRPTSTSRARNAARLPRSARHSPVRPDRSDRHAATVRGRARPRPSSSFPRPCPERIQMTSSNTVRIQPFTAADFDAWLPLWRGYQAFYKTDIPAATTEATWKRMLDPAEPMHGALAWIDGRAVGMVHWIMHRSCWTVGDYCYLQDLFVDPDVRGGGIGRKLIETVYADAARADCSRVWWLTHETNTEAMKLYDHIADKPGFVQYRKMMG